MHKELQVEAFSFLRSQTVLLTMDNEIFFRRRLLIQGFMKDISNLKPELPRQLAVWDHDTVLSFLNSLKCNSSFNDLSEKLAILLCFLSVQKKQTLKAISIKHMILETCTFRSLTDVPPCLLIFRKFSTQDNLIPHPTFVEFR